MSCNVNRDRGGFGQNIQSLKILSLFARRGAAEGAPAAVGLGDSCQRGADDPHDFIFWRIRLQPFCLHAAHIHVSLSPLSRVPRMDLCERVKSSSQWMAWLSSARTHTTS